MIVTHRYKNGKAIIMMQDIRFPNGPLSEDIDDQIAFYEWNTNMIKNVARQMDATPQRQQILAEYQTQMARLGNLMRKRTDGIRQKLDTPV